MFAEKIHIIQKIISRFFLVTSVTVTAFCCRCECSSILVEGISVARGFIEKIELLAQMNPLPPPHPLPAIFKMEDGAIITSTIRGRNLMVVQDELGSTVIVTGSGPRYDSQEKNELKRIFNVAEVVDIVDIIPYETGQAPYLDSSDNIRDIIFIFDKMRQIQDLKLGSGGKVNIPHVNISLIKTLVTDIQKLDLHKNFPELGKFLKSYSDRDVGKNLSTAGVVLGNACKIAINELRPTAEKAITAIINGMRSLTCVVAPYDGPLKEHLCAAITALEQRTDKDFCEVIKGIVSQKTKSVAKDIGDISLDNPLQQYALAHFLHSEQLAYAWMRLRAKNPKNYMYTQRGMCETCNPFMIRVLKSYPEKFYVLSTYPAQRPGREPNLEIDGTWSVPASDHGEQTVLINVKGTAKYLPVVRARDEKMPSVDNTESGQLPAQDEGLQLGIYAEKKYLEFLSNAPISSTATLADSDHEAGGAAAAAAPASVPTTPHRASSMLPQSSYVSATPPSAQPSHPIGSADKPEGKSSESKGPEPACDDEKLPVVKEDPSADDKPSSSDVLSKDEEVPASATDPQ